jgi:lipid II:glycine glycyltransferase (peptidoglycan interpeptide bridge formation enzyme)
LWGVYRFKVGFGGETTNFLGCLDLPLKEVCAAAWYRFESAYHQLY